MWNACGRVSMIVGVVALGGCQATGTGGAVPSGPALISPTGTASLGPIVEGLTAAMPLPKPTSSMGSSLPEGFAPVMPTSSQADQTPGLFQPVSAKPLKPARDGQTPYRLLKESAARSATQSPIRLAAQIAKPVNTPQVTDIKDAPVLKFEALSNEPTLGSVVSPRRLRELKNAPVNNGPVEATLPPANGTKLESAPTNKMPTLNRPLSKSPLASPSSNFSTANNAPLNPVTENQALLKDVPGNAASGSTLSKSSALPANVVPVQREAEAAAGSSAAQSGEKQSWSSATILAKPVGPKSEGDPRVKRLPPPDTAPRKLLQKRVLPQQPIPIYPELTDEMVGKDADGKDVD